MTDRWDKLLFSQILAIGAISILIIFSINRGLAFNQLVFWIIGLCVFYFFSNFDYKSWKETATWLYLITLTSLVFLLLIGDPVRGSVRWIDLGFFRIQPSELAKAASILMLAKFYSTRSAKVLKNVVIAFLLILPAVILVLIQPDIGNSLAFFAIWLAMSVACNFKLRHFAALLVVALITLYLTYELLAPYQKQRISTFINPAQDPLGTGYNIIQAKIATGSGGFFGKGFQHGSQSQLNFLPESESDFIFASISEQLGFLGAGFLIILFGWAISRLLSIAQNQEKFGQLIIFGIAAYLIVQFFVNVGMNMGIVPVTGITLPLVSYGGSSLITTLFLLGVAFSVNRWRLG